jgi:hypothetical protein
MAAATKKEKKKLESEFYVFNSSRTVICLPVKVLTFCYFSLKQDADLDILDSDEDEIDEDSAVYLESLQDKINKHVNGNMQVNKVPSRKSIV